MRARASILVTVLLAGQTIWAQTVEQGKKFYYYERFKSAREAFEKNFNDKPGNEEAAYWLGQTLIELKDIQGAKAVYQKALAANGSAPLVLVGMGHIELLEDKTADARQRFETAISLTKGKNIEVLNAVGKANAEAKAGDAGYAIEKLNQATTVKGFKHPSVYINMGNAYRKLADGGGAVTAYSKALTTDPKYAAGKYYTGRVYLSQNNREIFLPAFQEAVEIDPAYAPAYRELYFYYYYRDVNKAIEYFDKYVANSDPSPEVDYERVSILFAARKYQEAIDKARQNLAAQGANALPKYHRLIAHSYNELGDSVNALKEIQTFLSKAPEDMLLPADYALLGDLELKFPGQEASALQNLRKALDMDTSRESKLTLADRVSGILDKRNMVKEAAEWKGIAYNLNPEPTKTDLFYTGYAFIKAQEYVIADSLFGIYASKYPDEIFGYYWQGRARLVIDSTGEQGLAAESFLKFIPIAEKDPEKNKAMLITAYGSLASHSANVLKDKEAAIMYFDKILALDPENADAKRYKEILQKQLAAPQRNSQNANQQPSKSATGAK